MSVCCECCVLSGRESLRRADHSSREVLLIVARRCVWSRYLVNEEALAHWGAVPQKRTNSIMLKGSGVFQDSRYLGRDSKLISSVQ